MGVRGMDVSNHQAGMDVERVVRENNIGFVFVLSNDGTFKNIYYRAQMDAARRGGAIAVPYIYLRTNVDQTYATFRQQEPTPGPAIVDVEDGSGGRAECDRMHALLRGGGYTTPLLYWPDWYRKRVGSPSLAGLPPLWTSWYPDNISRGFDAGLAMLPAWVWNGYGGLPTKIVQFTSSGRLSGYGGNLDLNFFPGTRAELAALLGGQEEEDVVDEAQEDRIANKAAAAAVALLLDTDIYRSADPDEGPINPGPAKVRWILAALDAKFNFLKAAARLQADDEAKILAAVAAQQEQVDLSDEQLQALLGGISVQTKAALKAALREGTDA